MLFPISSHKGHCVSFGMQRDCYLFEEMLLDPFPCTGLLPFLRAPAVSVTEPTAVHMALPENSTFWIQALLILLATAQAAQPYGLALLWACSRRSVNVH